MAVNAKLVIGINLLCVTLLLAVIIVNYQLQQHITDVNDTMLKTLRLATELRQSSDDLTRFVRTYTVTGNSSYWDYFLDVIAIRDGKMPLPLEPHRIYWDLYVTGGPPRPNLPPSSLDSRMRKAGFTAEELAMVTLAKSRSDALIDLENVAYHAMIGKYRPTDPNVNVNTSGMSAEQLMEFSVSAPPNQTYAMGLVHGLDYHREKAGIMQPIDQFFVLSEKRVVGMEDTTRNGAIISALGFVVIAILTGLLIYTSIEHWKNLQHCRDLYLSKVQASKIAEAIGAFQLSEVEYLERLEKPDDLQQAFMTIAGNLKLYKPYLPSHLIDGDSDDSSIARRSSGSGASSSSLSNSVAGAGKIARLAVGLERRASTIVAVSNTFSGITDENSKICATYGRLSNWLAHMSTRTKGNLSMSPSGVYFVTYRGRVASAMELIKHAITDELEKVTFGCCHSKDVCGNIGGDHQRGFVNLGQSIHTAEVLSSLAARMKLRNLIEEKTGEAVPSAVLMFRCRVQVYESTKPDYRLLKAYTLFDITEAKHEEWMYGLSRAADSDLTAANEAIAMYMETGDPEHRKLIPNEVTSNGTVIPLDWILDPSKLPAQVCFISRVVSLSQEVASAVCTDECRIKSAVPIKPRLSAV
eukprot:TRINITY_DN1111_c0_g1_i3.p1 TRINITY_DN1111_c0_g1~~TRINITY_DN1111_c0_g1_i3.p1  ORF type:complete len:656 (+),score=104.73 TRINITY_DN1111_c0_g1_i3:55-1968(+)